MAVHMLPDHPWLVIFDLDGTLIDSSLDLCLSVNAAMAHVNLGELPHASIASYIGDGAATLVRRALAAPRETEGTSEAGGYQQERFERAYGYFLQYYREHKLDNTRLYDGVLESLTRLRALDPTLQMAVLTNKPVRPSREICDALGVSPFLFANYGGDSFGTKKPDPEGLLHLVEEGRVQRRTLHTDGDTTPDGVVMVGDSDVDVLTARRAGVRSLGCLYGLAAAGLQAANPDQLCSQASEWPKLLGYDGYMAGQSQAAPRTPLESP